MNRRRFLQHAALTAAAVAVPTAHPETAALAGQGSAAEQPGWWMTEPIRWLQTNLRETDAALDPKQFIADVARFNANVLMMSAGGITALYPSKVQYEYVSPFIPPGQTPLARFSRGPCPQHSHRQPLGFQQSTQGCIRRSSRVVLQNGGWPAGDLQRPVSGLYQRRLVLAEGGRNSCEALDRYDVDGCFFNNFTNPTTDYSERPLGLCHCDNCQRLYRERFQRDVPTGLPVFIGSWLSPPIKAWVSKPRLVL